MLLKDKILRNLAKIQILFINKMDPEGFEPSTSGLEVQHPIQAR